MATELERLIAGEIVEQGSIRFDRFMELALYQPGLGYYTRASVRVGGSGDFMTSPSLSPAFGRVLGGLVPYVVKSLGAPSVCRIVEVGCGEGDLIAPLLEAVRGTLPTLELDVVLVDLGSAQRERAKARAVEGATTVRSAESLESLEIEERAGLVIANELFDALPFRRLRWTGDDLEECFVGCDSDRFVPLWLPKADRSGPLPFTPERLPVGREVAFAPGTGRVLEDLADSIEGGVMLLIDYGYPASVMYATDGAGNPVRGFRKGTLVDDLLATPGQVDLTAHVDFSLIDREASRLGFERLFFTDQTYLLLALGFIDDPEAAAAKRLIHPEDMGGSFRALLLAKHVDLEPLRALKVRDRGGLL